MTLTVQLKLLTLAFFICSSTTVAQIPTGAFSSVCKTDTTIADSIHCATIKTTIPNLRSSTNNYVVNRINPAGTCFRPYVSPDSTGNLIPGGGLDDVYSATIILPFNFPFFSGSPHSLVVSPNGYISFDSTQEFAFSHYGLLTNDGTSLVSTGLTATGVNLPSALYDRAVIMAPYQDLNLRNGFATGQIKMDLIGTAPHRKWILTFNRNPLFDCDILFKNTQQLVLYEATGIIEVFIFDKEICPAWNQGKAIIGIQDNTRTKAIMAPGRAATDPAWGSIGMNESWRFTPAEGNSLFKKTELYTLGGQLVATGDTLNAGNGNYAVSFDSVCADSTTTYIVKSTYRQINNTVDEVYFTDTLQVIKPVSGNRRPVWTGAVSSEWENPLNWVGGILPDPSSDVVIPRGTPAAQLNSTVTINSITVAPGATLNVGTNYNLTILSNSSNPRSGDAGH